MLLFFLGLTWKAYFYYAEYRITDVSFYAAQGIYYMKKPDIDKLRKHIFIELKKEYGEEIIENAILIKSFNRIK